MVDWPNLSKQEKHEIGSNENVFSKLHMPSLEKEVRRCVCKARGSIHTRGCCSSNATCPETSRISWSGRAVLSTIWSFVWLVLKHTNIYKHANIFFLTEFVALRPPSSPPPVYYIISDTWWSDGGWLGMSVYIVSIANSFHPFGKILLSYFLLFQLIFSWYNRAARSWAIHLLVLSTNMFSTNFLKLCTVRGNVLGNCV